MWFLDIFVLNFCVLSILLKATFSPWILKLNFTRLVSAMQLLYVLVGLEI